MAKSLLSMDRIDELPYRHRRAQCPVCSRIVQSLLGAQSVISVASNVGESHTALYATFPFFGIYLTNKNRIYLRCTT